MGWVNWYRQDYLTHYIQGTGDLDMDLFIPPYPNSMDANQPGPFIVGMEGSDYGYYGDNDPTGEDGAFPYALLQREGGYNDWLPVETIVIDSRTKHGTLATGILATNTAVPYYPGPYFMVASDYGQTIDHDNDGCGNNYYDNIDQVWITDDPSTNTCSTGGSAGIPLLGAYLSPYVYVWKDGAVKAFSDMKAFNGGQPYNWHDPCNSGLWVGLQINTATPTGPVNYSVPELGQMCSFAAGLSLTPPGLSSPVKLKNGPNK
jgi:hypothetical protein